MCRYANVRMIVGLKAKEGVMLSLSKHGGLASARALRQAQGDRPIV